MKNQLFSFTKNHTRLRLVPYIVFFGLLVVSLHLGNTASLPPLIGWKTTKTQVVSKESTGASYNPSITIDSKNNVHVVWDDYTNYASSGTDRDIFYKMLNTTTQTWTTTQVVSTESTSDSYYPSIAIDSKNNVHVVWQDQTDYAGAGADDDIFYKMLNTTTQTWTTTQVVSTESTVGSGTPSIAIDSQDNVHVVWFDHTDFAGSGTDADIFYKILDKTSGVWSNTAVVSTESTGNSYNPSIAIDSHDNVHVVWDDATDYAGSGSDVDIFYKILDKTSGVWSNTAVVSTESTATSQYPSIAIDSQDNVHVAWDDATDYAGSGSDVDIFYKVHDKNSGVWSTTSVVSTESTAASYYPSIAVDGKGNVHVVWQDATDYAGSGGSDWDIFSKYYNSTSSTWSITQVIFVESTGFAQIPSMVLDSQANVHVVWQDQTDYAGAGSDTDILYNELVNLNNLPIITTVTQTTTKDNTISQVDTTTVVSTEVVTQTNSSFTPWYVFPSLLALVSVEIVLYKQRKNYY